MLNEITIQNYALINNETIRFSKGLNILSGETGAGKSTVAGAVMLLTGAKAGNDVIREGFSEATVTGVFHFNDDEEAGLWLKSKDISLNSNKVIIRRVVKKNAGTSVYLNSVPVTPEDLAEFSSVLFDIHGQNDHQTLLNVNKHRVILDRFGNIENIVSRFNSDFNILNEKKKKYAEMIEKEKENERERDYLKFAIEEITKAKLKTGEDSEMEAEVKILSQAEKIINSLGESYDNISETKSAALFMIKNSLQHLRTGAKVNEKLNPLCQKLESLYYDLKDVGDAIKDEKSKIAFRPEKIEELEERLAFIGKLKKKYGSSIEDILKYNEEAQNKLTEIERWDSNKSELAAEIKELEKLIFEKARLISSKRKESGRVLENQIQEKLKTLGMPKAVFKIAVEPKNKSGKATVGPYGLDAVEFLISPNLGEALKPLKSIASGGEMSRIMLAIKSITAEIDNIRTLIFDEIDSGIGGKIAVTVGEHLKKLAKAKQVLCITHLASIAAFADKHIGVFKDIENNRTVIRFKDLEKEEQEKEISRMLSGETGDISILHAKELLGKYKN